MARLTPDFVTLRHYIACIEKSMSYVKLMGGVLTKLGLQLLLPILC